MVVNAEPYLFRNVCEYVEGNIRESLDSRTKSLATFRDLGPPDLCHLVKSNQKQKVGTYHQVQGVEASSSATFSAYINSLSYLSTPKSGWKITNGTFCCFNAFSRVDVRVEVTIPGGVEAYILDLQGKKHTIPNHEVLWSETNCSAVLRAILDPYTYSELENGIMVRRLDPIPNLSVERRFLESAKAEFFKGWQLGSDNHVQVPTVTNNHLACGITKYFTCTRRFAEAARFFEPLYEEDAEVGSLLAKAYLSSNEELKAVKVMFETSKVQPIPVDFLLVQIDFLMSKNQDQKALYLAQMAVTRAPLEFRTWAKLSELYIHMEDYESALLALNSCPMYTFPEPDAHNFPPAAKAHLPLKDGKIDYDPKTAPNNSGALYEENSIDQNNLHPELRRLVSVNLRGTFALAYQLLIEITTKSSWDDLLKIRSKVFVMEEEYRIHRSTSIVEKDEDGKPIEEEMETITLDDNKPKLSPPKRKNRLSIDELIKKGAQNAFEQPIRGRVTNDPRLPFTPANFKFRHKRLCEKWLDNLFMVLYNDLRVYSAMKKDLDQYIDEIKAMQEGKKAGSDYSFSKTGAEWEVFGNLAASLKHYDVAKQVYHFCSEQKISLSALSSLLKVFVEENNVNESLLTLFKLIELRDRIFDDRIYPSPVANHLFALIAANGLGTLQSALIAMNVKPAIFKKMTLTLLNSAYFEYAELFQVAGANL